MVSAGSIRGNEAAHPSIVPTSMFERQIRQLTAPYVTRTPIAKTRRGSFITGPPAQTLVHSDKHFFRSGASAHSQRGTQLARPFRYLLPG